jgi:hypothetical protein
MLRGASYSFKQEVQAVVDYVIGEFYWKVEIGETVEATEFEGPGGKLSRERNATEVNYSFGTPLDSSELQVFGIQPPTGGSGGGGGDQAGCSKVVVTVIIIVVICLILSMIIGGSSGGSGGSYYGGGSWSK